MALGTNSRTKVLVYSSGINFHLCHLVPGEATVARHLCSRHTADTLISCAQSLNQFKAVCLARDAITVQKVCSNSSKIRCIHGVCAPPPNAQYLTQACQAESLRLPFRPQKSGLNFSIFGHLFVGRKNTNVPRHTLILLSVSDFPLTGTQMRHKCIYYPTHMAKMISALG